MIRLLQLLPPEDRLFSHRIGAAMDRVREGLLRNNRVVPVVLSVLALLIFAWLIAGFLIEDPSEEETSKGAVLSQAPEEPQGGTPETPAPEVENRDTDSYAVFESKDPFRNIISKTNEDTNEPTNGGGANRNGGGDADRGRGGGGEFIDQSSTGRPGSGSRGSNQAGGGGSAGQGGGTGSGRSGDLFNSGGNLPKP